jgi:hypothetical protein
MQGLRTTVPANGRQIPGSSLRASTDRRAAPAIVVGPGVSRCVQSVTGIVAGPVELGLAHFEHIDLDRPPQYHRPGPERIRIMQVLAYKEHSKNALRCDPDQLAQSLQFQLRTLA